MVSGSGLAARQQWGGGGGFSGSALAARHQCGGGGGGGFMAQSLQQDLRVTKINHRLCDLVDRSGTR